MSRSDRSERGEAKQCFIEENNSNNNEEDLGPDNVPADPSTKAQPVRDTFVEDEDEEDDDDDEEEEDDEEDEEEEEENLSKFVGFVVVTTCFRWWHFL